MRKAKTSLGKKRHAGKKAVPGWQVVENVVAAIESVRSNVPGMKVTQKAMVPGKLDSDGPREVDVLVEIPVGDRTLRIGVDVKNEQDPLDVVMIEQLGAKSQKLVLDRYCVLSTSGFSANGEVEAKRVGIELATLDEFRESDFWRHGELVVTTRKLELLHVTFEFDDPEPLQQTFADRTEGDITVVVGDGSSRSFREFATSQGIRAINEQRPELRDGEDLAVLLVIEDDALELRIAGNTVPTPRQLSLIFRCHVATEGIADRRFRLGGIEAVTHQFEVQGEVRQVTLLAITEPGDAGPTRKLAVVARPVKPKRTNV